VTEELVRHWVVVVLRSLVTATPLKEVRMNSPAHGRRFHLSMRGQYRGTGDDRAGCVVPQMAVGLPGELIGAGSRLYCRHTGYYRWPPHPRDHHFRRLVMP
jgi:hypothetical protein